MCIGGCVLPVMSPVHYVDPHQPPGLSPIFLLPRGGGGGARRPPTYLLLLLPPLHPLQPSLHALLFASSASSSPDSDVGRHQLCICVCVCVCVRERQCECGHPRKEFRNLPDGEADRTHAFTPASPASPDVYVLPLGEVALPLARRAAPPAEMEYTAHAAHHLKWSGLSRHSLLYLKEIGCGWFGKVLLGEVNENLRTNQVVVKELKASASIKEQMHFLEEVQPYRVLQHSALLQCLAQCTDVAPFLLVMEFCPLGDVKAYLRSSKCTDGVGAPEPLILQRMARDIASGLKHLHAHNFTHSDLALRNCLLTADLTVKVGDYGLSHTKYKDDYMVTPDQTYVPLRWIAPELVDDVRGNLLVAKQTRPSNIWSLGVTIWELLELGKQPYSLYSDRQVLSYAVREQQLRLAKPVLQVPLAERWYEVMQFCWLPPDQRPNAEEVHLLLSYLCAKGASEAEEDFERRWNSMRPVAGHGIHRGPTLTTHEQPSSTLASFPLLQQFSPADGYHSESGDDVLTITETSQGLNFEYRWEQARAEESYRGPDSSSALSHIKCPEAVYPPAGIVGGCPLGSLNHIVSPPYYQPEHLHAPGVLPVFGAHSPSVNSEFYVRIEEPVDCNIEPDYTMCSYSPDYQSSGSFLTGSADSGDCMVCPSQVKNCDAYWPADIHNVDVYDSNDSSPAISLTMEPLLGQVCDDSPLRPWESSHYVSYKDRDGGYYYENSPPVDLDRYLMGGGLATEHLPESWGSRSLRQALGELENPAGIPKSLNRPSEQVCRGSYLDLDPSHSSIIGKTVTGGYYDMMGSLRKTMPSHGGHGSVSINMETERALFVGRGESDSAEDEEEDIFIEKHTCNTWPSKHRHRSVGNQRRASQSCGRDPYVDFHYTMPSTDIEDSWPEELGLQYHSLPKSVAYPEPRRAKDNGSWRGRQPPVVSPDRCDALACLCHQSDTRVVPRECCYPHFVDPLTGSLASNHYGYNHDKVMDIPSRDELMNLSPAPGGPVVSKTAPIEPDGGKEEEATKRDIIAEQSLVTKPTTEETTQSLAPPADNEHVMVVLTDPQSETSQAGDSGLDRGGSSVSLTDILDCSDNEGDDFTDDITDITSGIFAEESGELSASPAFKSLQKQVGTPDSIESMDLLPVAGSCEGSGTTLRPSCSPKAMDSGYDTENYESPEFVLKEPHESKDQDVPQPAVRASPTEDRGVCAPKDQASCEDPPLKSCEHTYLPLSQETPYRDSAYFSDYENERQVRNEQEEGQQTDDSCDDEEPPTDTVRAPGRPPGEDRLPEPSGTYQTEDCPHVESLDGGLDEWPSQEENSSLEDWAAEVVGAMEEALDALNGEQKSAAGMLAEDLGKRGPVKDKAFGTEVLHILPKDEVALQHAANFRRSSLSSPPPQPVPAESGGETDREDGDSDDSDASDEEPRTFGVREEEEEESEDECHPVPIVVSDDSHAHTLRGLLKTPGILSLHEELERRKRNVSFFDDVTIYLFDQESPTKELTAHGFPLAVESSASKSPERLSASDDASDGNISEESAGLEWEDDFPLLPLPTSSAASDPPPVCVPGAEGTKSTTRFSRFTVSPSVVSRFSITHISDSDMDSAGGSSEDGDKE
ncbi:serine/threonine-protein kinase LMTK1 isoform X2 [Hippocampus zosterae]|uniref:serine/threonine-protein kinase LMTK1 isoform X2 n=1 Tax=Hippocampus zosterae TaxID=109293 RepID=UPI00223CDED5|nr:serine/threonine-protein kinase LMTK1 isoform X2 [Hippocampus zosterae]